MIELRPEDLDQDPRSAWVLPANAFEREVLEAIRHDSVPLASVAEVRNGIQTSANRIFIVPEYKSRHGKIEFEQDGRLWEIEEELSRPYLNDSSRLRTFHELNADARVIFPYVAASSLRNSSGVEIIPLQQMQEEFPKTFGYLQHHRHRLEQRDRADDGAPFYAFGRTQALGYATDCPKIVYSVNQRGDKYGVDLRGVAYASGGTAGEVGLFVSNAAYEIDFLLGLLSQAPIEFFLRKRGSPFRGGYYSRGSDVIADLPVPRIDPDNASDAKFARHVIDCVREIRESTTALEGASPRQREQRVQTVRRARINLARLFAGRWNIETDRYWDLGSGLGPEGVQF